MTSPLLTPEIIERAQEAANDAGDRYEEFATSAMIRAALEAVIPSLACAMPADPTSELLGIICVEQWPADWERGKDAQRRLGLSVVPPNTEMEIAAGQYLRLRDAIRSLIPSKEKDHG